MLFFFLIFYTTFHASAFNPCKINFWVWCDIGSWISLLFSIYVYLVVLPTFFFPLDCYCQKSIDAVTVCLSEKAVAPDSDTLSWKIPWTEEPGGLQSTGSLRVEQAWAASFHFSLSCIGEGNGNPLQCSCLENHRDGGSWLAAVYGVAQSRTWLKRLSSSSSSVFISGFSVLFAWSCIPAPIVCYHDSWGIMLQVLNEILWVLEVCSITIIVVMAMLGSVYVHTDFIVDLLVIKTKPSPKASWKIWWDCLNSTGH